MYSESKGNKHRSYAMSCSEFPVKVTSKIESNQENNLPAFYTAFLGASTPFRRHRVPMTIQRNSLNLGQRVKPINLTFTCHRIHDIGSNEIVCQLTF